MVQKSEPPPTPGASLRHQPQFQNPKPPPRHHSFQDVTSQQPIGLSPNAESGQGFYKQALIHQVYLQRAITLENEFPVKFLSLIVKKKKKVCKKGLTEGITISVVSISEHLDFHTAVET